MVWSKPSTAIPRRARRGLAVAAWRAGPPSTTCPARSSERSPMLWGPSRRSRGSNRPAPVAHRSADRRLLHEAPGRRHRSGCAHRVGPAAPPAGHRRRQPEGRPQPRPEGDRQAGSGGAAGGYRPQQAGRRRPEGPGGRLSRTARGAGRRRHAGSQPGPPGLAARPGGRASCARSEPPVRWTSPPPTTWRSARGWRSSTSSGRPRSPGPGSPSCAARGPCSSWRWCASCWTV